MFRIIGFVFILIVALNIIGCLTGKIYYTGNDDRCSGWYDYENNTCIDLKR